MCPICWSIVPPHHTAGAPGEAGAHGEAGTHGECTTVTANVIDGRDKNMSEGIVNI